MAKVKIGNIEYKVIENLGFNHSVGHYAKIVEVENEEKVVVKINGLWRFWNTKDRIKPMDHYQGQ